MGMNSIHVVFAEEDHAKFADEICRLIYESALQRGTGIAKRSPEYIAGWSDLATSSAGSTAIM